MTRELYLMTLLRDQIWKDVNIFLEKREINMSDRMQVLSLRKRDFKAEIKRDEKDLKLLLESVQNERIAVEMLTDKTAQAIEDLDISVTIAKEMVELASQNIGNKTWVMMSRVKAHR